MTEQFSKSSFQMQREDGQRSNDEARLNIVITQDELAKLKIEAIHQKQTLRQLVRERLGLDKGNKPAS